MTMPHSTYRQASLAGRWAWLLLILALACVGVRAQEPGALERQAKAACLYKFAGFVEWPEGSFAGPDSALVIGVVSADALAEQIEQTVAGHSANGRVIVVKKLQRGVSLSGLHILFIGAMERGGLQDILAASRGLPLLTVSDMDQALESGSMVNFVMADEKLRFEVSLKPVAAARLKISARMLSAAFKVQPGVL